MRYSSFRNTIKKKIIIFTSVAFMAPLFVNSVKTYAYDNNKEYKAACTEALETVQAVNEDELEVTIGDIYDVYNSDGKVYGYSMGFFVGDDPYGYAVYDLENKVIQEFMFEEGVENLYKEIKKQAEDVENVDADNLIKGVVYEGGLDYSAYDTEGSKIEYDSVDAVGNEESRASDVKIIKRKSASRNTFNTNMGDLLEFGDNAKNYNEVWCSGDSRMMVPDAGLTMIDQEYVIQKLNKYGCALSAITGIFNWMGILYDNSIDETYNTIWNKYVRTGDIEFSSKKYNEKDYYYMAGGIAPDEVIDILNDRFEECGLATKAYSEHNITFDKIKHQLNVVSMGYNERHPFLLGVSLKSQDTGRYAAHVVNVVAALEGNSNKKYIGVYPNWDLSKDDNKIDDDGKKVYVNNSVAEKNIRYINYNNLMGYDNVSTDAIFFKNVMSKNIKETNVNYISPQVLEYTCVVPANTAYVAYPTWTAYNGQDDIVWHVAYPNIYGSAPIKISTDEHNGERGKYITHIYAFDSAGHVIAISSGFTTTLDNTMKNLKTTLVGVRGYRITGTLPDGIKKVKYPTWTKESNQGDLIWYEKNVSGKSFSAYVDVSDFNNMGGDYITHIYAYDKYDNLICFYDLNVNIDKRVDISDITFEAYDSNSLKVACSIPTGTYRISINIKADNGIGNTYTFYADGGLGVSYISKKINWSDFARFTGKYAITISAYNIKGTKFRSTNTLKRYLK